MTNNAERELLPCPFCGSKANADYFIPLESIEVVYCTNDKCVLHNADIGIDRNAWQARAQASGVPDESTKPRFFMSHGTIHDRVTGRHVTCEPDAQNLGDCNGTGEDVILKNPDGITATLKLLNELHRAATPTPLKPASVPVERLEAFISKHGGNATHACDENEVLASLTKLIAEHK
jgi:hypothetical protein